MNDNRCFTRLLLRALPLLLALPLAAQTVPGTINYQGRLTDNGPLQTPFTGLANLQFAIWDNATAGSALWVEPAVGATPVPVENGIFTVLLGSNGVPVSTSLFSGGTVRYLELIVNGETLTPRQRISATGYANQSENAALASNATNAVNAGNSAQLGAIAAAGWQQRVSGTCSGAQAMNVINSDGSVGCVSASGGGSLSGTPNYVVKFITPTTGGDSLMFDNGAGVGIGTPAPGYPLHVLSGNGTISMVAQQTNAAGDGLWGANSAPAGAGGGAGVIGLTGQSAIGAAGLWGENSNPNGTAVVGAGNGIGGSVLTSGSGGAFIGLATGLFAKSTTNGVSQTIYTDNFGSAVRVNYWSGATQYKIFGTGTVSTHVVDPTDSAGARRVTLHAPESPEIYFMDFGQARLVKGIVHIELDPRLAGSVAIDKNHPLRVFIQLEEDENSPGVVVKNKTATGFDVVERGGGKSGTPFQWQVICNRADEPLPGGRVSRNADQRFETVAPDAETLSASPASVSRPVKP